ncbi:MAG TPA: SigE family RNA polymerase sigma factor [Arachnia sp.]|nr:SigE family RNA polymerase sigma factor [Arachnia sp.]HMT85067.1 SigE family RNA polymerase sigma factor [Arachnia sp.]
MMRPGFEAFVGARGRELWRAAWLLTGDPHKAEDLVQTALTKSYPRYSGDDRVFEAYVRTTIYRTYCTWWRRKWRGEVPSDELPEGDIEFAQPELSVDLARALSELPRAQRAVLVLRYYEDRTIADVADLLGLAEGTVKAYTHHAIRALRASGHLKEES